MLVVVMRCYKYAAPLGLKCPTLKGIARERDSSGTTERVKPAKVMERIARRERTKCAKRLAQKLLFVLQKYSCPYFTLFRQLLIIFTPTLAQHA